MKIESLICNVNIYQMHEYKMRHKIGFSIVLFIQLIKLPSMEAFGTFRLFNNLHNDITK